MLIAVVRCYVLFARCLQFVVCELWFVAWRCLRLFVCCSSRGVVRCCLLLLLFADVCVCWWCLLLFIVADCWWSLIFFVVVCGGCWLRLLQVGRLFVCVLLFVVGSVDDGCSSWLTVVACSLLFGVY